MPPAFSGNSQGPWGSPCLILAKALCFSQHPPRPAPPSLTPAASLTLFQSSPSGTGSKNRTVHLFLAKTTHFISYLGNHFISYLGNGLLTRVSRAYKVLEPAVHLVWGDLEAVSSKVGHFDEMQLSRPQIRRNRSQLAQQGSSYLFCVPGFSYKPEAKKEMGF